MCASEPRLISSYLDTLASAARIAVTARALRPVLAR